MDLEVFSLSSTASSILSPFFSCSISSVLEDGKAVPVAVPFLTFCASSREVVTTIQKGHGPRGQERVVSLSFGVRLSHRGIMVRRPASTTLLQAASAPHPVLGMQLDDRLERVVRSTPRVRAHSPHTMKRTTCWATLITSTRCARWTVASLTS